jgi:hypothetical protein
MEAIDGSIASAGRGGGGEGGGGGIEPRTGEIGSSWVDRAGAGEKGARREKRGERERLCVEGEEGRERNAREEVQQVSKRARVTKPNQPDGWVLGSFFFRTSSVRFIHHVLLSFSFPFSLSCFFF